ncbi:hypothetical protein [Nonomuraea sp. NPDC049480]|uniref:hypothetical protein n=1 Tax=Nonomuraea sp. NPDC049480 TaxID=3364353 RepID=UPI00379AA802
MSRASNEAITARSFNVVLFSLQPAAQVLASTTPGSKARTRPADGIVDHVGSVPGAAEVLSFDAAIDGAII